MHILTKPGSQVRMSLLAQLQGQTGNKGLKKGRGKKKKIHESDLPELIDIRQLWGRKEGRNRE